MRQFVVAVMLTLGLVACGGSSNCKDACNKLESCGFKSSGISCSSSCGTVDANCAACINDGSNSCSQLVTVCAQNCPAKTFIRD